MSKINLHATAWVHLLALLPLACSSPPPVEEEEVVTFPPPPDAPRIQFLLSLRAGIEIEPGRSGLDDMLFGDQARFTKPFVKPGGVAVRNGLVFVCDGQLGGIYQIDFRGKAVKLIQPKGRGQLMQPTSLFFTPNGHAYVTDQGRRQVVEYDDKWKYIREFGGRLQRSNPIDVAVWKDRIYIADSRAGSVTVLDRKSGKDIMVLGTTDDRAQELRAPTSLTVDQEGNVYVVDTVLSRIQVWNKEGEHLRTIGQAGDRPGNFLRPKSIRVSDRTLWVIDTVFENCTVLNLNGHPLLFFGGGGTGPGQLYLPRSIWIGKQGLDLFKDKFADGFVPEKLIIITNQFGPRKLSFYALGKFEGKGFEYEDPPLPPRPTRAKEDNLSTPAQK